MNTTNINEYLKILNIRHTGVYASDRLPTDIAPSSALVVNTLPHTESGEHWVVFYLDKKGDNIEYFDSFGRAPYLADYQRFLRRNSRHRYIFNRYRLQGYDTSVCGHYCLTYLYCRSQYGISMNDYVQLFDVCDPSTNDVLVRQLFDVVFQERHS